MLVLGASRRGRWSVAVAPVARAAGAALAAAARTARRSASRPLLDGRRSPRPRRRRRRRRRCRRRRAPRRVLPAMSGSSARRRPMRPRSRSTSTTRTLTSSPLLSTSSTRLDALAGRDVRDVQQAVGALGELDEGAEGGRLDDLADVLVADLDLLHHHPDALHERVAELAVGGVDQHLAVVVDVDLGFELLGQAADRFAALADQQADLATGRSGSSGCAARTG